MLPCKMHSIISYNWSSNGKIIHRPLDHKHIIKSTFINGVCAREVCHTITSMYWTARSRNCWFQTMYHYVCVNKSTQIIKSFAIWLSHEWNNCLSLNEPMSCTLSSLKAKIVWRSKSLQYIPRNMHTVLCCFALLWLCNRSKWIHMKYLSIYIRVALLALGQSLDCHSASEVSLMDMGKSVNV